MFGEYYKLIFLNTSNFNYIKCQNKEEMFYGLDLKKIKIME